MPADRDDASSRRSVVPQAAGRSLPLAAAWTGFGASAVAAIAAITAVAICWLPASAGHGNAGSAIRAGVLTYLAALHGGVTVDGLNSAFVPLGMTLLAGLIAWRAGCGLADAADDLGEQRTGALLRAAVLQVLVFGVLAGLAARTVELGTSSASTLGAALAGVLLFAVSGGVAFVRYSPLADRLAELAPPWTGRMLRTAAIGLCVYLAAGALLVAGSLVLHHHRVEEISRQVGGGWSGAPILLLGILAALNAVIAGSAYLAGPGFALGVGHPVSLGSTPHGTLPAFPVLGAVPAGPADTVTWLLAAATPIVAGLCVAQAAYRAPAWRQRIGVAAGGAGLAALGGAVLGWQGGGAIGSDRLSAVGPSPWQLGLALGAALAVVGGAALAALAALEWLRGRRPQEHPLAESRPVVAVAAAASAVASAVSQRVRGAADDVAADDTDGADDAADDRAAGPAPAASGADPDHTTTAPLPVLAAAEPDEPEPLDEVS